MVKDLAMEKEMATHSSILAWRVLCSEEPGGLLSMGSHVQNNLHVQNLRNAHYISFASPYTVCRPQILLVTRL